MSLVDVVILVVVDVASPLGGVIPVDPKSVKPVIRCADDDRFLADDELKAKVTDSLAIGDLDVQLAMVILKCRSRKWPF